MTRGCVTVETTIEIERTPQCVFDYITTPALWQTWHPATAGVREVPERPLVAGETAIERIAMGGRTVDARWTVVACEPPRRWEIQTDTPKGSARIVYLVEPASAGSRFHRTLEFRSRGWWRILDSTLVRLYLERQSRRALLNLRRVLEG